MGMILGRLLMNHPGPENTPGILLAHLDIAKPYKDKNAIIYRIAYHAAKEAAAVAG